MEAMQMKKLILSDEEYEILQKVLKGVPPAHLPQVLPNWDGVDMFHYRNLLTKVLHKNYRDRKTDDGMEG